VSNSSKTLLALVLLAAAVVLVGGYAVWSAVDEKTKNRQRCEAVHTRPVSTGHSHYLCVAPDGRVVAP
jgi:hypothetical protein